MSDDTTETDEPDERTAAERKEARFRARMELAATVILAIATVLTAWSAFQSSKWGGVMSIEFSSAGAVRTESAKSTTRGSSAQEVDVSLFQSWLSAFADEQDELREFYEQRFRDEFEPAFEAWLATDPLSNPDAPPSPFAMDEYVVADLVLADEQAAEADAASQAARDANQQGDDYTLMTVLFASVLFFAGISTKFVGVKSQILTIGLGVILLVYGAVNVATFPVEL